MRKPKGGYQTRWTTPRDYPFERFSSQRNYYCFDFLPGNKDVIYSANTSGQFNVWRQTPPSRSSPGASTQLTGFDEWSVRFIEPSPDGRSILAFADKDGDENYQIFRVNSREGWQSQLVMKPGVRNTFGTECLSPNGKYAAYASNERSKGDMDIVVTNTTNGKTKPVLADGAVYEFCRWSPDGRFASILEDLSTDDYNVHLLDMQNGKKRNLTPHKGKTIYFPGPWSPDGLGFYILSNLGREFSGLGYLTIQNGGRIKWLETPDWDVEDVALAPDGGTLACVVNREGYSDIQFRSVKSGASLGHPVHTRGVLWQGWIENRKLIKFSPDSNRLICLLTTPTKPMEVLVLRVPGSKFEWYTHGFIGNVPESRMCRPKLVKYRSFDREIPALLYRPSVKKGRRAPVVVSIHGGPEAQERPMYRSGGLYQYLVSIGMGVLATNIRGSTGYGKSYQRLIHHDWGGGELKDIEHAARYLRSLDWVDPAAIGVFGGSFGGFAALSAVARLPEYWSAAVEAFGPSNLVTFVKSVPEFWKRFMDDWVGNPDKETDFLLSRSPITFAKNIRCPMLVIQGALDPRVVKAESDQLVERLRSQGQHVEYIVFPDEGHGFTKRRNEFTAYKAAAEFFSKHLIRNS
jgi:dipeptidyl aminopeptidase/acylaminoacyl peptidase